MQFRSPLANVKGLGSAGDGVHHWWQQRLTALALVPLTLWMCFSLAALPASDYAAARAWIESPVNAVLLIMTIATVFYHGYLGLQVVVEDYVGGHGLRTTIIVASGFVAFTVAIASIFVVLKFALAA